LENLEKTERPFSVGFLYIGTKGCHLLHNITTELYNLQNIIHFTLGTYFILNHTLLYHMVSINRLSIIFLNQIY